MASATALVTAIRQELGRLDERILSHPYIKAIEAGTVPADRLRLFAGEQYLIIKSDLRSVAQLVSRFGDATVTREFFLDVLAGEKAALKALSAFAGALGMTQDDLDRYEPLAGAHAYTCYMAWLGLYGSEAEVAAAYLLNFPAWGANCGRLSLALRAGYGLPAEAVAFFDLFADPPAGFEVSALAVIQAGLDRGVPISLLHRSARLLQAYELMYWDTLAADSV